MNAVLRSPKGRIAAIVGGALLIVAAAWFLLISPQKSKAQELDAQVSTARAELSQRRLALAQPSASVRVRPSDLFRLTKAMPDDAGMPEVLLELNRLAASNDLDFRSIAPSSPLPGTGYVAQPVSVVLEGRFGNISRFLGDVGSLVTVRNGRLDSRGRLYAITQVVLSEPESAKKFPIVQAKLTMNAYSFSAPQPAAKPDPSTTDQSSSGTVAAGATP
jgi:Tfp pilus assembly protein PilO